MKKTVILVDRVTHDILKTVETDNVQFTIDALMRNRDPKQVVAREVKNL